MPEKSYSNDFSVVVNASSVYNAITTEIDKWWTTETNTAASNGDILTVGFGKPYFIAMQVEDIVPNKSLSWKVIDANMFIEERGVKTNEWIGTTIHWSISEKKDGSQVSLFHEGLIPSFECYNTCKNGWNYFLESLKDYLNTGKGRPHIQTN